MRDKNPDRMISITLKVLEALDVPVVLNSIADAYIIKRKSLDDETYSGNLQVFAGQDTFNSYAHFLKSKPAMLWPMRLGLLAIAAVHIVTALRLARENRAARPVPYTVESTQVATRASRSMVLSGMMVFAFVLYHLAHFTVGLLYPEFFALKDSEGRHDAYSMLVLGFQQGWVVLAYCTAIVFLGMHLSHGISSFFQTVGLHHSHWTPLLNFLGPAVALVIVLGYLSIPLGVAVGAVELPEGVNP